MHPSHWPPRVTAGLPLPVDLIVVWGSRAPLRLRARLTGSPARRGLDPWTLLLQRGLGEKSIGSARAVLIMDGVSLSLYQSVLARTGLELEAERRHREHVASCAAPMA
jgi:hypothetical protein